MPPPSAPPPEARQAAWTRLWQILLREPINDDVEQLQSEPNSESAGANEASAPASSEKEAIPVA